MLSFHYLVIVILFIARCSAEVYQMSEKERLELREEARDMFYHAYRAYMENAYPADELMPLSCAGRYRGLGPSRGDIDDSLGNFSLTLIDTLDTLVVLGDLEEFENGVKLVLRDVSFDNDIVVSVFETNIRVLGGLLSAHILAEYIQDKAGLMRWYKGELLTMAKDLGYRLLPAFNTTTGIPYARVNLKYGIKTDKLDLLRETCTACAGTIILEMAALSRLSGEPIFEQKAQRAMDQLWRLRHRGSDLMGTVLNVDSGDWIRRDSGVGAGIDSYYEYCLKAYVLLGDHKYLNRFNRHYNAVMKYISQGPMLLDVHMHRPHTNSRNYMDALLAFWPGLQVLKGDIKPAIETHEMLYQVMQRHKFIPEAFTTDFKVHWPHHPLRPEFLESTYFLFKATKDPYYLKVGKKVLKSLQKYARVSCGYAAVSDVRTGSHEDRLDSFVLAETFKYLFLLFSHPQELFLDLEEFIFTTEAHLLPLRLSSYQNQTKVDADMEDMICPSTGNLFPEDLRSSLKNMVQEVCPREDRRRRLTAGEFQISNLDHLKIVKEMGINILVLNDGRIQLLHAFTNAKSPSDAQEGLIFMKEMLDLSNQPTPQVYTLTLSTPESQILLKACSSHFSPSVTGRITGKPQLSHPFKLCQSTKKSFKNRIIISERGECMFVEKARIMEQNGAIAGIILDNVPGTSFQETPIFSMYGDGKQNVDIPIVFLFHKDAQILLSTLQKFPETTISIEKFQEHHNLFHKLKLSVKNFFSGHKQEEEEVKLAGIENRDLKIVEAEESDLKAVETEEYCSKNAEMERDTNEDSNMVDSIIKRYTKTDNAENTITANGLDDSIIKRDLKNVKTKDNIKIKEMPSCIKVAETEEYCTKSSESETDDSKNAHNHVYSDFQMNVDKSDDSKIIEQSDDSLIKHAGVKTGSSENLENANIYLDDSLIKRDLKTSDKKVDEEFQVVKDETVEILYKNLKLVIYADYVEIHEYTFVENVDKIWNIYRVGRYFILGFKFYEKNIYILPINLLRIYLDYDFSKIEDFKIFLKDFDGELLKENAVFSELSVKTIENNKELILEILNCDITVKKLKKSLLESILKVINDIEMKMVEGI